MGCPSPGKVLRWSEPLFGRIVELRFYFSEQGIVPSVAPLGHGGQNPKLLEAFRRLDAAEARRHTRDRLRAENAAKK